MGEKSRHRELGIVARQVLEDGIDGKLAKSQERYRAALKAAWPKGDEKLIDAIIDAERPIDDCRRAIVAILDGNLDRAREILGI